MPNDSARSLIYGKPKKLFRISDQRKPRMTRPVFARAEQIKDPKDEPPFYIRGIVAGSKEEYWVSLALDAKQKSEGIGWEYQVPIFGGRQIAGGLVIDFVVYTPGRKTWISPMGAYWHLGIHEDRMDELNAALVMNVNLITFFTHEITKETTLPFIKRKLGL